MLNKALQQTGGGAFYFMSHMIGDGAEYDATYRWQSDPDNYPRFTGYVYLANTKSPGLEALFPIHR